MLEGKGRCVNLARWIQIAARRLPVAGGGLQGGRLLLQVLVHGLPPAHLDTSRAVRKVGPVVPAVEPDGRLLLVPEPPALHPAAGARLHGPAPADVVAVLDLISLALGL